MKRMLLISAVLMHISTLFAQTGKEFWFAVPYVDWTHDKNNSDAIQNGPNFFRISSGEAGARVIFYHFPGGDAASKTELLNFTLGANTIETVTLVSGIPVAANKEIALTTLSSNNVYSTVLNKGLYISASNPVTIYYEIGSYNNTDIFALKGTDALGTEFFPSFQNLYENEFQVAYATDSWESVDIVATEDGTDVTIDLPASVVPQETIEYRSRTCIYNAPNMLKQKDAATAPDTYYVPGGGEDLFSGKKVSTYLNGIHQTTVNLPKVWLPALDSTDVKYNHWRSGTTVIDAWWEDPDPTKRRTTTYFQEQFDHTVFSNVTISMNESCGAETVDSVRWVPTGFGGTVSSVVSLNAGQTYSIKSSVRTAQKPFDGIRIASTKPIAVTTKDDSAKDGFAADVVGDQSIPTRVAGFKYIVPDFNTGAGMEQAVFVRALHDGTVINIEGATNPVATLNKGEIFTYSSFSRTDTYKFIYGNDSLKPFMCFHVAGYPSGGTGTDTELAGAIMPPVDQYTGSMQASFNQPQTTSKIVLLSRTNEANTFKYKKEGTAVWNNVNPTFAPVDIGGRIWYISFDLVSLITPAAGDNYLVKNTKSVFHLGILSRMEDAGSYGSFYGYFSDYSKASILASFDTLPDGQVVLYASGGIENSYEWALVSPAATSGSCEDHFFTPGADCNKANPLYIDKDILNYPRMYKYRIVATTPYGEILTTYIQFEVTDGHARFVPLPVEFIGLAAYSRGGGDVSVQWSTASETNSDYFCIERAADASVFEQIGTRTGAGNKSTRSDYSFTDHVPGSGTYYYRIKQNDLDSKCSYSKTASVLVDLSGGASVFPTVVHPGQSISILPVAGADIPVEILIYSQEGKCITASTQIYRGKPMKINAPDHSGYYNLTLRMDGKTVSSPIIVQP